MGLISPVRSGWGRDGRRADRRERRGRHFAVDKSVAINQRRRQHRSTTYPPPVHSGGRKHSLGGNSGWLLHNGHGRTVKSSRGNAARARRETGRPGERDASGSRAEGRPSETGPGADRRRPGATPDPLRSTTSRPQVPQGTWVRGRCGRATGSTVLLLVWGHALRCAKYQTVEARRVRCGAASAPAGGLQPTVGPFRFGN